MEMIRKTNVDDDVAKPSEVSADVRAWQAEKVRIGLKDADEGLFASSEAVRAVIRKFIPNS